jgi:hypothetical protein
MGTLTYPIPCSIWASGLIRKTVNQNVVGSSPTLGAISFCIRFFGPRNLRALRGSTLGTAGPKAYSAVCDGNAGTFIHARPKDLDR